jgi:tRNA(fMet)-specific endonuclease VapC
VIHFLDTNTVIYALKGTFPGIPQRIRERSPDEIKIPSIVEAELLYGAEKSSRRTRTLGIVGRFLAPFEIVPFGSQAARHYATIRGELESRGLPIGPNDLVIAATVLARSGVLVTHNTREFERVSALCLEDWTR